MIYNVELIVDFHDLITGATLSALAHLVPQKLTRFLLPSTLVTACIRKLCEPLLMKLVVISLTCHRNAVNSSLS